MIDETDSQSKNTNRDIVPVYGCPRPPGAENSVVKSETEVRHGTVHFLAPFSRLQPDTNLNIPPSNWLRSSSKLEQRVRDLTWVNTRKHSEFSSIGMANKSLDLTGEVDVISNAENIKKLLKLPFSKSHVSLMVHRIGKSLLIDDFDIHRHLLRQERDEWAWLRHFFHERVSQEQMKCIPRQSKSRHSLRNRSMYSKFLYHSLQEAPEESSKEGITPHNDHLMSSRDQQQILPDVVPEPSEPQHDREVLWTFEDIQMLIGTDLPIFCHDSYYVSLRLRDMRTPINVLTGLDYWLDNLMCNVPEVAMCFHINGIVKKYEVLKTEDIPHLENSKFDPLIVTDIAKNILSFLKTKATQEGHTYWLYKGVDDDVVKLYDLTGLCADSMDGVTDNPFTVPIGMLLYRVARNIRLSQGPHKVPVIRTLLENCLFLLDEEKHSQVCTSANYLLSDLFVPDTSLQDDWNQQKNSATCNDIEDDVDQDLDEDFDPLVTSVDVETLCTSDHGNKTQDVVHLKPIIESIDERCLEALKFILKGLMCLNRDLIRTGKRASCIVEEQAQCNSEEAIPMDYKPLNKAKTSTCTTASTSTSTSTNETEESVVEETESQSSDPSLQMASIENPTNYQTSWHYLSKTLLYRKSALTFVAMARLHLGQRQFQEALRCLQAAFHCYAGMESIMPDKAAENVQLLSTIYGLIGDVRLVLSKIQRTDKHEEEEKTDATVEETAILDFLQADVTDFKYQWAVEDTVKSEENLKLCIQCYQEALRISEEKQDIVLSLFKRLGNAENELGVFYMQQAQQYLQKEDLGEAPSKELMTLWKHSKDFLQQGISTFESIADIPNQVLLHCNLGRLLRLCAQTYTQIMCAQDSPQFTEEQRQYFKMAIEKYEKALRIGSGLEHRPILDSVSWELSTTYFNMATLLQDYAPLSTHTQEDIEKEIVDLMNKSLKFCKTEVGTAIQPMYQYRAATINHRLASLFHNSLRNKQCSEQRKKYLRQLAENHYERAFKLFHTMECSLEGIRLQLERLALVESNLSGLTNPRGRIKVLLLMLSLLIHTEDSFRSFVKQLGDPDRESKLLSDGETVVQIAESRIQFCFLNLTKAFKSINNKKSKHDHHLMEEAKRIYSTSLQQDRTNSELQSLAGRCNSLVNLLSEVSVFHCRATENHPPD